MKKYNIAFNEPVEDEFKEKMLKFLRNHYKKVELELSDDRLSGILSLNRYLKEITHDALLLPSNIESIHRQKLKLRQPLLL